MATVENIPAGVINPEELYTLKTFTHRLGIKASTLRSARRAGLQVYYVHKHGYIYGRDWIDYVRSSKTRQVDQSAPDAA
jgi:hypothetical protein